MSNARSKDPCLGCTERYIGCHGTCERYKAKKEADEKRKQIIAKNKAEAKIYIGYQIESVARHKRRGGKK